MVASIKITKYTIGLAIALLLVMLVPVRASAAAVTISLASTASSVQQGDSFQVTVNVSTSGVVSDVLTRVTFDSSKLSLVTTSYSGSPLTEDFGSGGGNGYYTIDRYKLGAPFPSGTFKLATLTFSAIASGSSTTVNIASANSSVGDGNTGQPHSPLSVSGVNITLTSPPSAPTATPPSPGTARPASSNQPAQYTPPTNSDESANNAETTELETVESTDLPEPSPESLAQNPEGPSEVILEESHSHDEDSDISPKVAIGLAVVFVIGGITFVVLKYFRGRGNGGNDASGGGGASDYSNFEQPREDALPELDKIKSTVAAPGEVIDPKLND